MAAPKSEREKKIVVKANTGRKMGQTQGDIAVYKQKVLGYIAEGLSVRAAMAKVGRSVSAYDQWRARDPQFAESVDKLRAKIARGDGERPEVGDFGDWREKYLKRTTYRHQWQWVDMLEGREPRDLDESQTYLQGRPQRLMINTPPFHAKSTTITMDWVVYKICEDPNVRIIIVSEGKDMAQKFLMGIKDRLTSPRYQQMHDDFGPPGGFKVGSNQWAADKIYVGNRDTAEKDPTVEVLGVGSQIYGARADYIVCDDVVTLKTGRTQGQRDKIIDWLDQEVSSRLGPSGKLLIVGTRVSANDVYRTLLTRKEGVWTYLAQPAVQTFGDTPEEWVTLWPVGNDEYGDECPMWDGPALATRKDEIDTATWSLVYMQQQVSEDAVFPEEAVKKCTYSGNVGPLEIGGVRKNGSAGTYTVIGLDPATPAGYTAMVVLAVDKQTRIRYVLDVVNQKMTPYVLREKIKELTYRYRPNEWRIEKNGLNQMVSQDHEIRQFLSGMNCRVVEHQTSGNKWDADYGVASLAPLFLGGLQVPPAPLIVIPNNHTHKGVNALIDQLITWSPETPGKTDTVMALWFADLGCRAVLDTGNISTFAKNRWLTDGQRDKRRVINLQDYLDTKDQALA